MSNQQGLYPKFDVFKRGVQISHCFVLRIDRDPFARIALRCYADACQADNPLLAGDLHDWLNQMTEESKIEAPKETYPTRQCGCPDYYADEVES